MRRATVSLKSIAAGVILVAGSAHAGLTETVTIVNDYDFRGISQSAQDDALQLSVDYTPGSGWYLGAWGSNVEFGDATSFELDIYTGFSGSAGSFGYDVGVVWYTYDESIYNFPELYASATIGPFKGKVWYSNEFAGVNIDPTTLTVDRDSEAAYYVEGNLTFPLDDTFSLLVHAGYSFGDYWDEVGELASAVSGQSLDGEYLDYSVGLSGTFGKFTTTLKYVDTDTDIENDSSKVFNNDRRIVIGVATTFPWGD